MMGYITSPVVEDAFLKVPREEFVPPKYRKDAYLDSPLPLFHYDATISAPHMTVLILEYLKLVPGLKVLEVGAGSGYQAALIAEIVCKENTNGQRGHVYTIEIVSALAKFARDNLSRTGYEDCVTVLEGDGSLGYPAEAPYDRIVLTAAARKIPPPLLEQLKPNGILVLPLGSIRYYQTMVRVTKKEDGTIQQEELTGVAFVPLKGKFS